MCKEQIIATVKLAHQYGSAFNRRQVHQFLPIKIERAVFDANVNELVKENRLQEEQSLLLAENVLSSHNRQRQWSKQIFNRFAKYLRIFSTLPWVRYIGLTGSNAFESCCEIDDIDLFVVTAKKRLWILYCIMVVIGKITGKREFLCINYLIDEDNLAIEPHNYFVAVQILQMRSLFNDYYKKKLIEHNPWIFYELPNARNYEITDSFYNLKEDFRHNSIRVQKPLNYVNRLIYKKYARRLENKYQHVIKKSIILGEGTAKLHRVDYCNSYNDVFQSIEKKAVQ